MANYAFFRLVKQLNQKHIMIIETSPAVEMSRKPFPAHDAAPAPSKLSRLEMIAQAVQDKRRKANKTILPLIAPTRQEISQEVCEKAINLDDSILDESANVTEISPMMKRCTLSEDIAPQAHSRAEDGILTPTERARAKAEREEYRKANFRQAFFSPRYWLAHPLIAAN